jgi:hypothetical protein
MPDRPITDRQAAPRATRTSEQHLHRRTSTGALIEPDRCIVNRLTAGRRGIQETLAADDLTGALDRACLAGVRHEVTARAAASELFGQTFV